MNVTADKFTVLDEGYIKLVEHWGSDQSIVEAARMSTSKGFLGWGPRHSQECYDQMVSSKETTATGGVCTCQFNTRGDEKLLEYLYEHQHMTPFEMGGMILEIQAPIFVFREWQRHRTQSYNELSARYIELPDLFYVPSIERLKRSYQSSKNKQSSSEAPWDPFQLQMLQEAFRQSQKAARAQYKELLSSNVSREIARLVIPVSQYSRMRASANLRNWLAFLTLRTATAAQFEIREYANYTAHFVQRVFPRTYDLWYNKTMLREKKI